MTTAAQPGGEGAAAPVLGTPEHDAAMIALADSRMGEATPTVSPPSRPEGLPEKYTSVADLAKAYAELEKKLGAPKPPIVETKPSVADVAPVAKTVDEQKAFLTSKGVTAEDLAKLDEAGVKAKFDELSKPAVSAVVAAKPGNIDMAALNAEFAEKGDLSPETRAKLESDGYPKEIVDSFIAGQKAIAEKWDAKAFEFAGGKESFDKMAEWAKSNFTPADAAAYNEAVTSGDEAKLKLAVQGLKSSYEAAEGIKPTLLQSNLKGGDSAGFKSNAEMTAAMRDPRYKTDPAYRQSVEAKVHAMNTNVHVMN